MPRNVAAFVHLISFGANLGAQLYTTFVLGIVMIRMLKVRVSVPRRPICSVRVLASSSDDPTVYLLHPHA